MLSTITAIGIGIGLTRLAARWFRPSAPVAIRESSPPEDPATEPWSPPSLDTPITLPDPVPSPVSVVDLVSPAESPPDSAQREAGLAALACLPDQPFDERRCWGCERGCKRSSFRPYAGANPVSECMKSNAQWHHSGERDFARRNLKRTTRVADLWLALCAECVGLGGMAGEAERDAMRGPVVEAECPF